MCGIVGYIGKRGATELLIEGLHRLEYRGYDSAGVAVMNGNGVETRKAAGKIVKLEEALSAIVASYPRYIIVKDKLDRPKGSLDAVYSALKDALPGAEVDTQDGLRLTWPDRWVHVRPSGTEPIVRVIAEAPSAEDALKLVKDCRVPLDRMK